MFQYLRAGMLVCRNVYKTVILKQIKADLYLGWPLAVLYMYINCISALTYVLEELFKLPSNIREPSKTFTIKYHKNKLKKDFENDQRTCKTYYII